mgnify:CR=1 FL=1
MAAQDFLILHGEKLAVGLIGVICAVLLFNAFTNDGIRSTGGEGGISAATIKSDIEYVVDYRPKAREPVLEAVPEYAAQMKEAFSRAIPATPLMAWTTAHPDMGPGDGGADKLSFVYVYELLTPILTVNDVIGSFVVTVALPEPQRSGDRLSDKDDVVWSRKAGENNLVSNSATVMGAVIEQQVGMGPWEPINEGKPLLFDDFLTGVSVPTVDYETYSFRARLLAVATGYRFEVPGGGEVMVANGRWQVAADAEPTEEDFRRLMVAANTGNQAALAGFLRPVEVADLSLKANESAYLGPQTEPVSLRAQSALKFQLLKLDPDPEDPAKSSALVLLTKLIRAGERQGWLEMQKFSLKPGMKLGKPDVPIPDPTTDSPLDVRHDLTTPFELVKVDKDVERILYYELKAVARKDGKPGKELEVRPKVTSSDTATFKNTKTGELLVLAKLVTLSRPANPDAMITPDFEPVDEQKAFRLDPGTFVQQELKPPLPTKHAPGTGPLAELLRKGEKTAETDTDYYEMPDGRLYYYEPLNKKVLMLWKPGVTPKPKVAPPKVEPQVPPGGRQPALPEGMPPGLPPGLPPGMTPDMLLPGMPLDLMPPGMTPPEAAPAGGRRRR